MNIKQPIPYIQYPILYEQYSIFILVSLAVCFTHQPLKIGLLFVRVVDICHNLWFSVVFGETLIPRCVYRPMHGEYMFVEHRVTTLPIAMLVIHTVLRTQCVVFIQEQSYGQSVGIVILHVIGNTSCIFQFIFRKTAMELNIMRGTKQAPLVWAGTEFIHLSFPRV